MKKFRLNTKSIFITLPRCSASKEECLKIWTDKLKNYEIEDYLIVQEHHKEGGELEGVEGDLHIHAALFLKKRCDLHTPQCLDVLEYHGKYESMKNKEKTIEYLLKEDGHPLESRNWKEWLMQSKNHKKCEKNKEDLTYLLENGPRKMLNEGMISIMNYQKIKKTYEELKEEDNRATAMEKEDLPYTIENPWGINMQVDIDNKKCHYWIYSSMPNLGKTTWATELCSKYRVDFWNYIEIYQPQIGSDTEGIILDEYRGQLKISQLNQICDGNYYFTAKGRTAWKLSHKPIVFILANKSPSEVYSKKEIKDGEVNDISLIEARFNIINISSLHKKN